MNSDLMSAEDFGSALYRRGITYNETVRFTKRGYVVAVLKDCRGNQCKAARRLGMHRNTLARTIEELHIDLKQLEKEKRRAA